MQQLYKKNHDGSYEPVNMFFYGDPIEGVWLHEKSDDGDKHYWVQRKVDDVPSLMRKASFARYKAKVIKAVDKRLNMWREGRLPSPPSGKTVYQLVLGIVQK